MPAHVTDRDAALFCAATARRLRAIEPDNPAALAYEAIARLGGKVPTRSPYRTLRVILGAGLCAILAEWAADGTGTPA